MTTTHPFPGMNPLAEQRKLAAILFTDMVGDGALAGPSRIG
jgi:hypothetical protein